MQGSAIGIGPAFEKARVFRGKTIEEASRDTRIRPDYLLALEREAFEEFPGDVYIRGFLRSYAVYLGLNSDKVVRAYTRSRAKPPTPAEPTRPRAEDPALRRPVRKGSWRLAGMVAVVLLVVALSFGLLSNAGPAPAPAALPSVAPSVEEPTGGVTATLDVERDVRAVVTVDGVRELARVLRAGEALSFDAESEVSIQLAPGGAVVLKVNGEDLGVVGGGDPYARTFTSEGDGGAPSAPTG